MRYTEDAMPRTSSSRPRRPGKNPSSLAAGRARNRRGIPADRTNLTPAERALLPHPDWVTEDDADAITGMRRERTEKPIPLEKLKRYGYRVEG